MKDLKTTVLGALGAAAMVIIPLIQSGSTSIRDIVVAGFLAALGYHSSDKK